MGKVSLTIMKTAMALAVLLAMGWDANAQQQAIFEFHHGFWVNLHQFLFEQAQNGKSPPMGSPEWREVVAYYRREIAPHDHLTDEMAALNNRLSRAADAGTLEGSGVDAPLAA